MKKSDLASHVATQAALSKAQAHSAVDALFSAITEALARGARQGRNPHTGESIAITASKAPSFKTGKSLRAAVRAEPGP